MDPSRAAELTDLIQRLDAEIPIEPALLILVDQAMTHVSSGRACNLEQLKLLGDTVLPEAETDLLVATTKILRWDPLLLQTAGKA